MAKRVKFKANIKGFNALRNSEEVQQVCLEHANRVKANAESIDRYDGVYETDVQPGRTRCVAMVKTADGASAFSSFEDNTLGKALHG